MKEEFIIQNIEGFQVLRDDMYPGGTKRRVLRKTIQDFQEVELVYACDYHGCAPYAIGLAAQEANMKVKLFYFSPLDKTEVFEKTTSLPNVTYEIIENTSNQMEIDQIAKEYSKEQGAKHLVVGLGFPKFKEELEKIVKEANIDAPEIWCLGGSGTLAKALHHSYPNTPMRVVNRGTSNANFGDIKDIYHAPEEINEKAEIMPPYVSSPEYDAKVWRFVLEHAVPGAFIWNVS